MGDLRTMRDLNSYELAAFIATRKQAHIILNVGGEAASQAMGTASLCEICVDIRHSRTFAGNRTPV
jgi:hypothetical protein